jgi:hypothetical protein
VVAFGGWSTFVVDPHSSKLIHKADGEHWPDYIREMFIKLPEEEPHAAPLG